MFVCVCVCMYVCVAGGGGGVGREARWETERQREKMVSHLLVVYLTICGDSLVKSSSASQRTQIVCVFFH